METDPLPSIIAAVHLGRGRRGWKDPGAWVCLRAQLLSALTLGYLLVWLAAVREMRPDELNRLIGDAVLRGEAASADAEAVCAATWQRWCAHGDDAACVRLLRGGPRRQRAGHERLCRSKTVTAGRQMTGTDFA